MTRWFLLLFMSAALASASTPLATGLDPRIAAIEALLAQARFDEAAAALDAAISATPSRPLEDGVRGPAPANPQLFVLRGRLNLVHGTLQEAQRSYAEAARLDPTDETARRIAATLARKADVKAYASGVEAYHRKAWGLSRSLLEHALAKGNLGPEHTAVAQQYLVVATFAQARVADEIRRIQEARRASSQAFLGRRITPSDADNFPVSNAPGNPVAFQGRLLERHDVAGGTELVVSLRPRGNRDRFAAGAFSIYTPYPIAPDPRLARGALVWVTGHLIDQPASARPGAPRVSVMADRLEAELELPGRGLAGPLRVDFLRYTAEQLENLPPGSY